jgi:hypothetical protein
MTAPVRYGHFHQLLNLVLAIIVVASFAFGFLRSLPAFIPVYRPHDLGEYYAAATILNSSAPGGLYDRQTQERLVQSLGLSLVDSGYVYPPFFAAILRPFVAFPFQRAAIVWLALCLFCLLGSVWLLLSLVRVPKSWASITLAFVALLIMPPTTLTLVLGQATPLLLLLLAVAFHLLAGAARPESTASLRDEVLGGAALGLAGSVKLYPLLLLLPLLVRRRWWALGTSLACFLVCLGVGVVGAGGFGNTFRFFLEVLPRLSLSALPGNHSLLGWVSRVLSTQETSFSVFNATNYITLVSRPLLNAPESIKPVWLALCILFFLAALCTLFVSRHKRLPMALDMGLPTCLILILPPLVWDHYHSLLLLPASVLLGFAGLRRQAPRTVLLVAALLLGAQRYDRPFATWGLPLWGLSFSLLAAVMIFGYLIYVILKAKQSCA